MLPSDPRNGSATRPATTPESAYHLRGQGGIANCVHCGKELHEQPDRTWRTWDYQLDNPAPAPAPIERPEGIARAIGMLERNRASLVFEGKPKLLAHFLEMAIKWGLALEQKVQELTYRLRAWQDGDAERHAALEVEVARLRADKDRLLKALSLAFDYYMGPGACGDFTCNCGNCGICEMRDKTRDAINAARKEAGK